MAVAMGVSCVATNCFGVFSTDTKAVLATSENKLKNSVYSDEYRSSYRGNYEVGTTYYDIGTLYGHAYHDGTSWTDVATDDNYQREGWQVYNVTSFLDSDGDGYNVDDEMVNTLPFTTDINTPTANINEKELMCWQVYSTKESYRSRYLERTDIPDFGTPTFAGDSTPAYYIAKGEVTRDEDDNVFIEWTVRAWVMDDTTWINSDTFADVDLTGLSGAIESGENPYYLSEGELSTDTVTTPAISDYFEDLDAKTALGELSSMWSKADFDSEESIAESLTFGDDIDTWWKGVAASIYTADATFASSSTETETPDTVEYDYTTSILIDNVADIYGNSLNPTLSATANSSVTWTYGTDGKVASTVRKNGDSDAVSIFYNSVNLNANASTVNGSLLLGNSSTDLSNAITVEKNTFTNAFSHPITMVRTINPSSVSMNMTYEELVKLYAKVNEDVSWNADAEAMIATGAVCNTLAKLGYISNSTYDDTKSYKLAENNVTTSFFVYALKEYANSISKNGYDAWPFDDTKAQLAARAGVTDDADATVIYNSVHDAKQSYSKDTHAFTFSNLSYADTTYNSATHATNFPVVGLLASLLNVNGEAAMAAKHTLYFSTGYQRAGGVIKAKRVSTDLIDTVASTTDANTGDTKTGVASDTATITDAVTYSNLTPGTEYCLVGALYDAETGGAIKLDGTIDTKATDVLSFMDEDEIDATYVKSVEYFTPTSADGELKMLFNYDASKLAGKQIVVCEKLYVVKGETFVSQHTDKTDADQTVTIAVPEIGTVAAVDGAKSVDASEKTTVTDIVSYKGLVPGKSYELTATVFDKTSNELVAGVMSTSEFKPEKANGETSIDIALDTTTLGGHSLVVYETVKLDGNTIVKHENPDDEDQTITVDLVPAIDTVATEATKQFHTIDCDASAVIIDSVSYTGLENGVEYTLTANIYDIDADKLYTNVATQNFKSEGEGTVEMNITFDTTELKGHSLVVCEVLTLDGKTIVDHSDYEDANQTVTVCTPAVKTVATNAEKSSHDIDCDDEAVIIDTVSYTNLKAGEEYTLVAGVYDLTDGKYLDATAEQTFTAASADGEVEVSITLDTIYIQGHKLVVTETLVSKDGKLSIAHDDFTDVDQTVIVKTPSIKTVAHNSDKTSKTVECDTNAVVVDTVYYTDFTPGESYQITAVIVDATTGYALFSAGKVDFTATNADGEVDVTITVDTSEAAGHDIVVTEMITHNGHTILDHSDLADKDQTVTVEVPASPVIDTVATDATTGTHSGFCANKSVINDKVSLENLTVGKEYTLTATLYNKATGEQVATNHSVSTTFTAEATSTELTMTLDVDTKTLGSVELVVFETLTLGDDTVATHTDLDDADQTVAYVQPTLDTVAYGEDGQSKTVASDKNAVVLDEVSYTGLVKGDSYTLETVIMDKTDDGKYLTSSYSNFKADSTNGTVAVTLSLDTTELQGHELVLGETLYEADGKTVLATHIDLDDADQTVTVDIPETPKTPEIKTQATSKATGNHTAEQSTKTVIVDAVTYTDLTVGKEYTLTATPYNKETGKALDGVEPKTITFVAEKADGVAYVEIEIDTTKLAGKSIVMFESLKQDNVEVAVHNDINDADQTVTVMSIGTKATGEDKKSQTLTIGKDVTVIDTVSYTGLTVGQEYTVTGQLVDKTDATKVMATSTVTFKPTTANGTVEVSFKFDTTEQAGKSFVCFETITQKDTDGNEVVIGEHKDINDKDQTVTVQDETEDTPENPNTGDMSHVSLYTVLSIACFVAFATCTTVAIKRRKYNK
jgi:hypothetical protein